MALTLLAKRISSAFCAALRVINDFDLLASLPDRDKRAGFAEAVKVALIRDRQFFEDLERDATALSRLEAEPMRRLIERCAELHVEHIAGGGDPFESGSARPLDFGHGRPINWSSFRSSRFVTVKRWPSAWRWT